MRKRLYAPAPVRQVEESALPAARPAAPEGWKAPPPPPAKPKSKISLAALFLGFAIAFFVIAGGVTAFVLFLGGRSVSTDHLDIGIQGPVTVAGGEAVPMLITIKNSNPVALTGASLTLQFPDGTTDPDDTGKPLPHYTDTLGDIPAGASVNRTVRAAFFGAENQKVSIPITVEYRTGSSNAVFVKKAQYEFTISTSPVGLSVTTLSETASGQPLTVSVLVRSNASAPLANVAVRAEYPFGFKKTSASPEPLSGELYSLGTLAPGEEREIRVNGTLSGQDGETRVFRFTAGALKSPDSREFGVSYTENTASVALAKPFFAVSLSLNRDDSPTIVARAGEPVTALLTWVNELPTPIQDGAITVTLGGDALNPAGTIATNGFYQSLTKTIRFDHDTVSSHANPAPGDTGNGTVAFPSKSGPAIAALRNPAMTLSVSVSGRRAGQSGVADTIASTITRTVKIQSDLSLSMRAVRSTGPYTNTGPLPPVPDQETTYTILLGAGNTVNTVANAGASMKLPSFVRFTGQTSGNAIQYNPATREVTWTLGDVPPNSSRGASFQVALLPSISQKGTSPTLVSEATLSGFDRFVQKQLSATASAVDIQTKTDSNYQNSLGTVK